jgi:hypothetical protein
MRLLATLALALGVSRAFVLPPLPIVTPSRFHAPHLTMSDDISTPAKITIRKPGEGSSSSSSANTESSGAKVSVRVRPKGDRAASAPAASTDDIIDDMTTTVTVKAPVAPPPAPPSAADLGPEEQMLMEGTQKANCSMMLKALQAGANPNVQDPKGRTPLHFIAGLGLAPASVLLIHFGAQLDARDNEGLTPMHMASGYANAQTMRVLVAAGADITVTGQNQGTPLEVVKALGEFQIKQFMNRTGAERFKKKDEKLEQLKECLDVLVECDKVIEETNWDELLTDVLKLIDIEKTTDDVAKVVVEK